NILGKCIVILTPVNRLEVLLNGPHLQKEQFDLFISQDMIGRRDRTFFLSSLFKIQLDLLSYK
ncbi:MAG: hypothetical protein D3910_17905, partial [Candidatus Electrothrix sp. ATG2]|nr:hypothetical protein [Candidatus Electrothrix sp. ATG2]